METHETAVGKSLLQSPILYHIWLDKVCQQPLKQYTWKQETHFLHQLGLGMEETMRYLFHYKPSFSAFEQWIIDHDLGISTAADVEKALQLEQQKREEEIPDVLSPADLAFWEKNGFIVLKNAIPKAQCQATVEAIWGHLGASPDDRESWYRPHDDLRGIMLTTYHHATLRQNRASKRIRRAYQQLYGTKEIYLNIDKVGYNPPNDANRSFKGSGLHWDTSLVPPISHDLQGLLYLTDTGERDGAFHCVPGFHLEIEDWLSSLPEAANPRELAPKLLKPIPVTGEAGDFVIWRESLPHCATPNHGKTPRMVQYMTYLPLEMKQEKAWR